MMCNSNDLSKICRVISETQFKMTDNEQVIKVGSYLPSNAVLAIAHALADAGLEFAKQNPIEMHARWICKYNKMTGTTEVTCSHCGDTRDIVGCYETTDGKSCYHDDFHCPFCGATMDLPN